MSSKPYVLQLAESPSIKSMILRRGVKGPLVRRFVAGELLHEALLTVKALQEKKILSAIDYLGENFISPEETNRAMEQYMETLKALGTFYPDDYLSVKLTAIGLATDPQLAMDNLLTLMKEARGRGSIFVRVDMEGSRYTDDTLQIVKDVHDSYENIGAVLQSYLRRTDKDVEEMIDLGISVRLVKGAYSEPPSIAYSAKEETDRAFRRHMFALLERGVWPSIATHDEKMVRAAKLYCRQKGIDKNRFEFEMLLGIRQDLQVKLAEEGFHVRVYVPYGEAWYAYFSRRLAERPANVYFLLSNLLKP